MRCGSLARALAYRGETIGAQLDAIDAAQMALSEYRYSVRNNIESGEKQALVSAVRALGINWENVK